MNADRFRAVYRELIEENPLALRAVLKILDVEFTADVPTLAVTCGARPRLLVNLAFLGRHCRGDAEVKAAVCHEFLHVLLRHTDRRAPATPAEHLACDAVINAVIHRTLGEPASRLMSRYYAEAKGLYRLLRPPSAADRHPGFRLRWRRKRDRATIEAWAALYDGKLVADDIRGLANQLRPGRKDRAFRGVGAVWLGNHDPVPAGGNGEAAAVGAGADDAEGSGARELRAAVEATLASMKDDGVFRSLGIRGTGRPEYTRCVAAPNVALERWRRQAYQVLRRHLVPDPKALARDSVPREFGLPVLSPGDRRAALRARWSPFLPDALWRTEAPARGASAQVYLDVSGSMNAEMPLIVALLGRLSRHIRRPFWAFSEVVAPARIEKGKLVAGTTGGTSMTCVLEHVARTKPEAAVVVTDGYIERIDPADVAAASRTRLHVIVTRGGQTSELAKAGLPFTQLERMPR